MAAPPPRLAPLAEVCREILCPENWGDAVAQAGWFASHCSDHWSVLACGQVNALRKRGVDTGHTWFFDATTGRLVGRSGFDFHGNQTLNGETPSLKDCTESRVPAPHSPGTDRLAGECNGSDVTAGDWKTATASLRLLCSEPVALDQVSVFRECRGYDVIAAFRVTNDDTTSTSYWVYSSSTGQLSGTGEEYAGGHEGQPRAYDERYGRVPDVAGCKPTLACGKAPP